MYDLVLIGKIMYYLLFVLALFLYAMYKYKNGKKSKFGTIAMVVFAILFGVYAIICGPPGENTGDRHNYSIRFEDDGYADQVRESSLGLYAVESILHIFTHNSSVLFFVISVLYFCINIYCYKKLQDATPLCLLLFFLSTLGLFSFYALKQAMSIAFANLAFTDYLRDKKKMAILFLIIAILFHEAAWMIVPCFLLTRYVGKSNVKRFILYMGVFAIAIFFPQINKFFVSLFSHIPGMDAQIGSYLDGSGSMLLDTNYFTIFKSAPFYLIMLIAIFYGKKMKENIKNYDLLLALSVFCSVFSVLSLYMYWMNRFAMYCYVPCFLLASELCANLHEKDRRLVKIILVVILLILLIKSLVQHYFIYGGIV